jgi:fluoride exporter
MTGAAKSSRSNTAILYVCVALGGMLGSLARYLASLLIPAVAGFPWATLFVNVTGSFIIGFYSTLSGPDGRVFASTRQRQFVMTGFCGGFTTFSAFSLQTLELARQSHWLEAGGNIVLSVVLCLLAVWLGHVAAAALSVRSS